MEKTKKQLEVEGKVCKNNKGEEFIIIEYIKSDNVIIQFKGQNQTKRVTMGNINKGLVSSKINNKKNTYKKQEWIGYSSYNNKGEKFTIVDYINNTNVIVQFEGKTETKRASLYNIKCGTISSKINNKTYSGNKKEDWEGKVFTNSKDEKYTILEYINNVNVIIQFEGSSTTKRVTLDNIKNKNIRKYSLEDRKLELEGKLFNNSENEFIVIKYNDSEDILIEFTEDNTTKKVTYYQLMNGEVSKKGRDYNKEQNKSYNIYKEVKLFMNELELNNIIKNSNKEHKLYFVWSFLLLRTLNNKFKQINSTYKNVTICNEWLDFNNFINWYENNYYEINEELDVDKDILNSNKKVYSPENCLLIPKSINSKFVHLKTINKIYKVINENNQYIYRININGRKYQLESYNKEFLKQECLRIKMDEFKNLVKTYEGKIPSKTYNILMGLE